MRLSILRSQFLSRKNSYPYQENRGWFLYFLLLHKNDHTLIVSIIHQSLLSHRSREQDSSTMWCDRVLCPGYLSQGPRAGWFLPGGSAGSLWLLVACVRYTLLISQPLLICPHFLAGYEVGPLLFPDMQPLPSHRSNGAGFGMLPVLNLRLPLL